MIDMSAPQAEEVTKAPSVKPPTEVSSISSQSKKPEPMTENPKHEGSVVINQPKESGSVATTAHGDVSSSNSPKYGGFASDSVSDVMSQKEEGKERPMRNDNAKPYSKESLFPNANKPYLSNSDKSSMYKASYGNDRSSHIKASTVKPAAVVEDLENISFPGKWGSAARSDSIDIPEVIVDATKPIISPDETSDVSSSYLNKDDALNRNKISEQGNEGDYPGVDSDRKSRGNVMQDDDPKKSHAYADTKKPHKTTKPLDFDNVWDIDGEQQHVELSNAYGDTLPLFSGNVESATNVGPMVSKQNKDELESKQDVFGNTSHSNANYNSADPPNPDDNKLRPQPTVKRTTRPPPLKRGTRTVPVRRRPEPSKPTTATLTSLIEKMAKMGDANWSEQIKCQNELSQIAEKYPEIINQCDPTTLVTGVRALVSQANSGRSNVCNGGIVCLGTLYKQCSQILAPAVSDVLDVCIKKAAAGSPEFICNSANATLAKICLGAADLRLATILSQKYKKNKSAQGVILNCMIILFDTLDEGIDRLKSLEDIITIAISSLGAGSLQIRGAAKILIGTINEKKNLKDFVKKMRIDDGAVRTITTALQRYKEDDKIKYLDKLKSGVV